MTKSLDALSNMNAAIAEILGQKAEWTKQEARDMQKLLGYPAIAQQLSRIADALERIAEVAEVGET